MKHKLLNFSKNLIIALGLVVIVMMLFFTTSSYAASGSTLGEIMRQTISDWYRVISRTCMTIYSIGYLIIIIKLMMDRTPEKLKKVKVSISQFIVMFIVIYFLHIIMISIILLNNEGIEAARNVGKSISGIDMESDEFSLYETALSKAYEIAVIPGFIGLIMYLLLVFYTYKFAIIYAKRFINIVILMLLAPIIFVVSTLNKIITGVANRKISKWFKEFIFNVVIQTFHAIFYAIFIGFTLKLAINDDNIVGSLLVLIFFGMIFKIDGVIRKIFNFVGGNTAISGSRTASKALSLADSLLDKPTGGAKKFGKDLKKSGTLQTIQNQAGKTGQNAITFRDNVESATAGLDNSLNFKMQNKLTGYLKNTARGKMIKTKYSFSKAVDNAKADAKDISNILDGKRVKENLTEYEIVRQYHIMEEGKGLEGIRQKIHNKGKKIDTKIHDGITNIKNKNKKIIGFGKYTGSKIKKLFKLNKNEEVEEIEEEFVQDVSKLNKNIETVKRLPRIIKSIRKDKKYVNKADGLDVDVSNTMMLVVDSDFAPEEIIKELKVKYGNNIDVQAFVFDKVGAQAFLSPAVGSTALGMSVLAETRYEEKAEHKLDATLTGKSHKKRKLSFKKNGNNVVNNVVNNATKTVKNSVLTNKVYTFSRFTPKTAKKITNKMLQKNVEQNRYLFVISKTFEGMQVEDFGVRGTISTVDKKTKDFSRSIKVSRKNVSTPVRQMKLNQMTAVSNYKRLVAKTQDIELANSFAGSIMNAKTTIRLGFEYIDNMTPGQIGLRSMVRDGSARELSNGLFAVKQNGTVEERLKSTGLFNETENTVLQFVIDENGELQKQIVTSDGRIVESENNMIQFNEMYEQFIVQTNEETGEKYYIPAYMFLDDKVSLDSEDNLESVFIPKEILQNNEIFKEEIDNKENSKFNIVFDEEGKLQYFVQIVNEMSVNGENEEIKQIEQIQQIEQNVDEEGNQQFEQQVEQEEINFVEQNLSEYVDDYEEKSLEDANPKLNLEKLIKNITLKDNSKVVEEEASIQENELEEIKTIDGIETIDEIKQKNEVRPKSKLEEIIDSLTIEEIGKPKEIVQHVVTLDGKIVEQVVNSNNTIETERYQIVNNGGEELIAQIEATMTNEDLGLDENATVDEKMDKFQDLLQDLSSQPLLDQILVESNEVEDTMDEAILVGMEEAGISSIKELRQLNFGDNLDDALLKKKEDFDKAITDHMISTGIVSSEEAENDDIVGNALEVLNSRVEQVTAEDDDTLLNKAANLERVKVAEEMVNNGDFSVENPPNDNDIDNEIENGVDVLSSLVRNLAVEYVKNKVEESDNIIIETVKSAKEVIENAKKSKEEIEAEKAVQKAKDEFWEAVYDAEKEYEKNTGKKVSKKKRKEVVNDIVSKENEKDDKDETTKITLVFHGGVETQGQSVTLSTKYSIKDFYDKANKLKTANLQKTQERFLQYYSSELSKMQLSNFSFAKHPVPAMDRWAIYVVTNSEDVDNTKDKQRELELEPEPDSKEESIIQITIKELIKIYFKEIAEIFRDFVEKEEIESMEEIYRNKVLKAELVKKYRLFFLKKGEQNPEEKAKALVEYIRRDQRFIDIIDEVNAIRLAKQKTKDAKSRIRVTTKENAEKTARTIPEVKINQERESEKSNLMNQILESTISNIEESMNEQDETVIIDSRLNNLLHQMKDKVLVGNKQEEKNKILKQQIMKH